MLKTAVALSICLGSLLVAEIGKYAKNNAADSPEVDFTNPSLEAFENSRSNFELDTLLDPKSLQLDSIFNYICQSKMVHKDIVMKQVIWETGWLKGSYLMSLNNLFGFKNKEYLKFATWKESVDYYEKWQSTYYLNPAEDYYEFLVRIKYSNSRYPAHLKSVNYSKTCDNS